jgi:serine/threonine-protein kinase
MTDETQLDSLGVISRLLRAAFTAPGLRSFCNERSDFRSVVNDFGPNDSLNTMVDRVVEYCEKQVLLYTLLVEVRRANRSQYERFEEELVASGIKVPEPVVEPEPPGPIPPIVTPRPQADTKIPFDWVTILAGEFRMGSDRNRDPLAYANEEQQTLYLPEYKIARVPVTVFQFGHYVRSSKRRTPTTAKQLGYAHDLDPDPTNPERWPKKYGAYWEHPHGPDSWVEEDHPVTCVSWDDARAFCDWAKVRLPTEAEWEKAARGIDARIYPWGNERPDENRCNFNEIVRDTTAIGHYSPEGDSPYGCADMAGNVWEWTSSLYRASGYTASDGREDPNSRGYRVLRGGSWFQDERNVRCATRHQHQPDAVVTDIGFRVCAK